METSLLRMIAWAVKRHTVVMDIVMRVWRSVTGRILATRPANRTCQAPLGSSGALTPVSSTPLAVNTGPEAHKYLLMDIHTVGSKSLELVKILHFTN